jgi:hypothetical protein
MKHPDWRNAKPLSSFKETAMTQPTWYRKYWRPWGIAIGYHDEGFLELQTGLREIHRHYKNGRFAFFSFVRQHYDHSQKDPYVFRSRCWAVFVAAVMKDETGN